MIIRSWHSRFTICNYWPFVLNLWCTPTKQGASHTGLFWHMDVEVGMGVTNNLFVDFEILVSLHTLICLYHFCVISDRFSNILPQTWEAEFSKSHFQRKRSSQKVGGWTWFWYQIKAESILLLMIPKIHFTQNVTCSLFCGSASHTFMAIKGIKITQTCPLHFPCLLGKCNISHAIFLSE